MTNSHTTSVTTSNERWEIANDGPSSMKEEEIKTNKTSVFSHASFASNHNTKKCVSFLPTVTVRKIPSRFEYSQRETTEIWYTKEEYRKIQMSIVKQINILNLGVKSDEYRGLEGYTMYGRRIKAHNREASLEVVLDEQCNQWNKFREIKEDEVLASRYRRTASSSQLWAHSVGLADQRAAESYYECMEVEEIRLLGEIFHRQEVLEVRKSCLKTYHPTSSTEIARAA